MLTCSMEDRIQIGSHRKILLRYETRPIGSIENCEIFDLSQERQYFHDDRHLKVKHIGRTKSKLIFFFVKQIVASHKGYFLGGDLRVFDRIRFNDGLDYLRQTPNELKKIFNKSRV